MSVFEPLEVATIAPAAAAQAHQQFQTYYAATLASLPALGLRWRIDVETRPAGESPEQQHQLVIWPMQGRDCYGLRVWLRQDGLLDNLRGYYLSPENLQARIERRLAQWAQERKAQERFQQRQTLTAHQLRETAYLIATVAVALAGLAWILFGSLNWIMASVETAGLLVVMSLVLDGWLRLFLYRSRQAQQVTKGVGWIDLSQ